MLQNDLIRDNSDIPHTNPFYFELAQICRDVYYDIGDTRPALPKFWFRDVDSKLQDDGYFGALYIKLLGNNQFMAVVAHRGTNLININEIGDLKADLQIFQERVPNQFESTKIFFETIIYPKISKFRKNMTMVDFLSTGHSLGAILSDCFASHVSLEFNKIKSITFENPGSKNIVKNLLKPYKLKNEITKLIKNDDSQFIVIQDDINFINTCNEQLGKVYAFKNQQSGVEVTRTPPWDISTNPFLNSFYLIDYTIKDQHPIEQIIYMLDGEPYDELEHVPDWPYGFQNGYVAYLDQSEKLDRIGYWVSYARWIWEKTTTGNEDTEDSEEEEDKKWIKFCEEFLKHLEFVHQEAKKLLTPKPKVSQIGIFKSLPAIEDDFVIVENDKDVESTYDETQYKKGNCSII